MNRIKTLRNQSGLTQIEFAKKFGIAQSTLSTWERGRYEPDFDTLLKLSDYFGVSVDYLLGRSDMDTKKEKPTEVNTVIKSLRTEKHISQRELAAAVNLTQQAVAKWEKGISEPDSDTLLKLADYFGVSVDYLLGRSDMGTKREKPTAKGDELSEDESKLSAAEKEWIQLFRLLSDDQRQLIRSMIRGIVQQIDSEE